MPTFAVTNATIWVAGLDMTSYLNKATLKMMAAELDITTFGATFRSRLGGLRDTDMAWDGFWTSIPDAAQFAQLGSANQAVTVSPRGTETDVAYFFQGEQFTYSQFGKIGEAAPFSATLKGSDGIAGAVRGQLTVVNRSVAGTGLIGSAVNLGLLGTGQYLYAAVHALTAGTTITIAVNSGTSSGSTPTQRAIYSAITTTGGYWLTRLAGPIATDTWWRFNVTADTGTWTISGGIGIR